MRSVQALQRCLLGDVEAGLAEWAAILVEVPDAARVHAVRGRWLTGTDPAAALLDLDRAVAIEPGNAKHYVNRGDCFQALGDPDRALANFRRALALDPEGIDVLAAVA